jgi:hypothetical protein
MIIDFGVFYTCYREDEAVEFSLKNLRAVYPDCPVYLVSDGGSDFSFLSSSGIEIESKLEHDSRGFIPKIDPNSFLLPENQKLIKDSIVTFLDRCTRAIEYCQKPWLLIMEPDVLVVGKLSAPKDCVMLGSRVNEGLSRSLRDIVNSVPGSIDVNHWGATPALFEVEAFKRSRDVLLNTPGLLDSLCASDCRLANYDVLISVMFALAGYEETFNPELVECLRNPYWRFSGKPLIHQYREKYPRKSTGYDGRHANDL